MSKKKNKKNRVNPNEKEVQLEKNNETIENTNRESNKEETVSNNLSESKDTSISEETTPKENFEDNKEDKTLTDKSEDDREDTTLKAESDEIIEQKDSDGSDEDIASAEKPLKPRKRMITKNNQLVISFFIVICALLTLFVWKAFFDNSLTGQWFYVHDGEYTESLDDPIESNDPIEMVNKYSQRVIYEFMDDGTCSVTLGTMSVTGSYSTIQTEDGNMLSASVYYQSMPLLYGSYRYNLSGNIFTGRKLTIFGSDSIYDIVLEQGVGDDPLQRYEDEKLDERLTGKWKDSTYNQYYTFTDDGHMILEINDRLKIEHVYTILEDGVILTRYYADTEQTYTYNYSFEDGELTINGSKMLKVE